MVDLLASWVDKYPICSIEDGCSEDDWEGWKMLTERVGKKVQLVGDDLFVTNTKRLQRGIDEGIANSILIKVNQIGTLTETIEAIQLGQPQRLHEHHAATAAARPKTPRSPTWPSPSAPAKSKPASPRAPTASAKYNQLLRIEEQLGDAAQYGGPLFPKR